VRKPVVHFKAALKLALQDRIGANHNFNINYLNCEELRGVYQLSGSGVD
jgi:hypothetical protein